jgi:DNA-binding NarL/FixJ family response regulator
MAVEKRAEDRPVQVAIIDDHPFFRQGVRDVLNAEPNIEVIAESDDGLEALKMLEEIKPQVVLMDVNLPSLNGMQVTRRLKSRCPDVHVVILTAYDDEEQIYRAIRIGASAYFAKDVAPKLLIDTIRAVADGYYVIRDRRMTPKQAEQWMLELYRRYGIDPEEKTLSPLTNREMEILEVIVEGLSNRQIANRLGISQQTVKNHVTSILSKLDLSDRTQAAIHAIRHGWVRLPADRTDEAIT